MDDIKVCFLNVFSDLGCMDGEYELKWYFVMNCLIKLLLDVF